MRAENHDSVIREQHYVSQRSSSKFLGDVVTSWKSINGLRTLCLV